MISQEIKDKIAKFADDLEFQAELAVIRNENIMLTGKDARSLAQYLKMLLQE